MTFDTPIANYMTRDLETADPDTPVHVLVRAMHGRGVSAIPIVDPDRHIVGVVSPMS